MILVDIEKDYGAFTLGVDFEVGDEVLALLGASGSGKSLTLKSIAGIEKPDRGRIILNDRVLFDSEKGVNLSPQDRRVGLMFQNYALFPHMTVEDNIRTGARRTRASEEEIQAMIQSFHLASVRHQRPATLSGGQQQRVALARMLISDPEIMLLDEPFSALDIHLRYQLELEMQETIRRFGKTVILVSHDQDEVYRLSDRIAVVEKGRITRQDDKRRLFEDPQTLEGARLTGCENISRLELLSDGRGHALDWGLTLDLPDRLLAWTHVGIRSRDIELGGGENTFAMKVANRIENPFSLVYSLKHMEKALGMLDWQVAKGDPIYGLGTSLRVRLPVEKLLMLKGK